MTDQEVLQHYLPMVSFIAEMNGPGCEVLMHDLTNKKSSVIAIENGHLSGRAIGFPITDLAASIVESEEYKTKNYLTNYTADCKGKKFLSSTYFIKNGERLIGLLCINRDLSSMQDLENILNQVKNQYNLIQDKTIPDVHETLDVPLPELIRNYVHTAIEETGISPKRMSMEEKVLVVHRLKEQGVLTMKGAVSEIAEQLFISEPTVYRYMKRK